MAIMEQALHGHAVTNDIFLCTIMGGILIGAGVGLVLRAGASSGGMDIPSLLMNKYLRIPLSVGVYIVDVIILALQALQTPVTMSYMVSYWLSYIPFSLIRSV